MFRRYTLKLLLLMASVVTTLFFGEVALRALHIAYPSFGGKLHFYTWDPDMGIVLRPGARGTVYTEGGFSFCQINSQGLRDLEHSKEKPANTFRIAVLGDSFAEAFEVPIEKTFWSVLEQELSGCPALEGKRVETINFGVSGYGTAQELQMLRHRVWDYSPDLVLLAFFTGNDVQNNSRALQKDPYRPYFVYKNSKLVLDGSFRNSPGFRAQFGPFRMFLSSVVTHCRLLQVVAAANNYRSQGNTDSVSSAQMGLDDAIYREPTDQVWREAWQGTEGLLDTMRDEVAAKGARFLIVTLSNGIQVDPDPTLRTQFIEHLGVKDLFYTDYRIKELGEREGIPVLTLAPAFQQYAEEHKLQLHGLRGRGHWNEEGHRLAGQMIARELCSGGLAVP
jgi:hypothetical protein